MPHGHHAEGGTKPSVPRITAKRFFSEKSMIQFSTRQSPQQGVRFILYRALMAAGTPFAKVALQKFRPQNGLPCRHDLARQHPGDNFGLLVVLEPWTHRADVEDLRGTVLEEILVSDKDG